MKMFRNENQLIFQMIPRFYLLFTRFSDGVQVWGYFFGFRVDRFIRL